MSVDRVRLDVNKSWTMDVDAAEQGCRHAAGRGASAQPWLLGWPVFKPQCRTPQRLSPSSPDPLSDERRRSFLVSWAQNSWKQSTPNNAKCRT